MEKEGQWLKRGSSDSLKRPMSEPAVSHPKTTFIEPQLIGRARKRSFSHALGFDRRKSEPSIGLAASEASRLSTISLQEPGSVAGGIDETQESRHSDRRSSARKIKEWAAAKMSRKTKDANKALTASSSASSLRPVSAGSLTFPETADVAEPPVAETDLDSVFSSHDTAMPVVASSSGLEPRIRFGTPAPDQYGGARSADYDGSDTMLDLDAALGPFKTPPIGSHRQRKGLHSSRLTKDFSGPGGHYHRRSESAPNLSPFQDFREMNTSQPEMADVFEEDENDTIDAFSSPKAENQNSNRGVEDPHAVVSRASDRYQAEDGLGIQGFWEPERPASSQSNSWPVTSYGTFERRGSSIVEETIFEEPASFCEVEIVEDHEEPRASSLTKSSDSSNTPTVLAPLTGALPLPEAQQSLMTPATYQTSNFSSPASGGALFDHARLGTAASSMTDNRTLSSTTTGDLGNDLRASVDVPSLTSSRSTMLSSMHGNGSRREFGDAERASSVTPKPAAQARADETRRKRSSIQSLSQLVGGSFSGKSKGAQDTRPQTSADATGTQTFTRKEHGLKRLMFWRSRQCSRQNLRTT